MIINFMIIVLGNKSCRNQMNIRKIVQNIYQNLENKIKN